MAETAKEPIKASDVPDKEIETAIDVESKTTEQKVVEDLQQDAVNDKPAATEDATNGTETIKDDVEMSTATDKAADNAADSKDAEDGEKDTAGDKSGSHSPDNKRKEPPVSVSAHDRYERKRPRGGGYGKSGKVKTRFEDQPESSDPEEIRRQVEFYFSDSNLPIDAYLLNETGGHKNRPVPLKVIHNFKRMRHFQPFQAVRDAVKESKFLELDDSDEITRKHPLSEKFTDDPQQNRSLVHTSSMARSIYAKGFGQESKTTHLDIEAFFEPYGPLNAVRLRRHDDGEFKGSVFVEFQDEDGQRQFLELDSKPQWEGEDLEIMSKQEYVDMKHQGIMDGTVKPRSPTNRGRGRGGGYGGNRDRERRGSNDRFDKDDWKSRRDRDQGRDSRDGRGRGRGRGRGDRGGRGRGGRGGNRRSSPDFRDRDRRRGRDDDDEREEAPSSRAEAEASKYKGDAEDRAAKPNGDATAGAPEADAQVGKQAAAEVKGNGEHAVVEKGGDGAPPAGGAKKRAREEQDDGGAEAGEAKKTKEDGAA